MISCPALVVQRVLDHKGPSVAIRVAGAGNEEVAEGESEVESSAPLMKYGKMRQPPGMLTSSSWKVLVI